MKTIPRTCLTVFLSSLAAAALLGVHSAQAQTDVTGTSTGAAGASGSGTPNDQNTYVGNAGGDGYDANGTVSPSYVVHDANFTGGAGGAVFADGSQANYEGGAAGSGLIVDGGGITGGHGPVTATVNSGTFTGGVGGSATGAAMQSLSGAGGGAGLLADYSTVYVNGGAFRGGDAAIGSGASPDNANGIAGSGLNVNGGSTVTVRGGTFTGGNGPATSGSRTGVAGDGLVAIGGTAYVYGGTFTGGTGTDLNGNPGGGYGIDVAAGHVTLFGRFTVNGVPDFTGSLQPGTGTISGVFADGGGLQSLSYIFYDFDQSSSLDIETVPEPSTVAGGGLLAGGALALLARRYRGASAV